MTLIALAVGFVIFLIGYVLHKMRVGRMESALGREVRDDEALSINTWMEVQDKEEAKLTGSTTAPPVYNANAAHAAAGSGPTETDGSGLATGAVAAAVVADTVLDGDSISDVADIAGGIFDLFS